VNPRESTKMGADLSEVLDVALKRLAKVEFSLLARIVRIAR